MNRERPIPRGANTGNYVSRQDVDRINADIQDKAERRKKCAIISAFGATVALAVYFGLVGCDQLEEDRLTSEQGIELGDGTVHLNEGARLRPEPNGKDATYEDAMAQYVIENETNITSSDVRLLKVPESGEEWYSIPAADVLAAVDGYEVDEERFEECLINAEGDAARANCDFVFVSTQTAEFKEADTDSK